MRINTLIDFVKRKKLSNEAKVYVDLYGKEVIIDHIKIEDNKMVIYLEKI